MKAVIIEDDAASIVLLKNLLHDHCKSVDIVGAAGSADLGADMIHSLQPDLVLLDIGLPGESGIELLEKMGDHSFDVIFITIHDHYAIQAIRCSALDYIIKPVQPNQLIAAVRKAEFAFRKRQTQEQITNMLALIRSSGITGHRIALPLMKELRFVSPEDIIHCDAANNYTHFYLKGNEKLIVSKGLFEFEALLEPYGIIRCHQSHLVNIKAIKSLYRRKDYVNELALTDGSVVPVSRLRLEAVRNAMLKR